MKLQKAVRQETVAVAVGTGIGCIALILRLSICLIHAGMIARFRTGTICHLRTRSIRLARTGTLLILPRTGTLQALASACRR